MKHIRRGLTGSYLDSLYLQAQISKIDQQPAFGSPTGTAQATVASPMEQTIVTQMSE